MYGGTKTEMERLIKDAEKLDKSFKAQRDSNGKLTLSFADVVDGIHIIQQNLGITGTSAEEAGTTIQGSMASVKAAWQDTLTAMGSGKDLDKRLDNLTKSVKKYGENMKPILKQALKGAVSAIGELAPSVAAEMPKLVVELAPDVIRAGADIAGSLVSGVYNEIANSNIDEVAKNLTEKINQVISNADAKGSGEKFALVVNKVIGAGFNTIETFDFKEAATKLTTWFNSAVDNINWGKLGKTVGDAWKGVWDFIGTSIETIDWENVGEKISEFINAIDWGGILTSMFKVIGGIIKNMPELLKGVIENLDFDNAASAFALWYGPKMAKKLLNHFQTNTDTKSVLTDSGKEVGTHVGSGLTSKGEGMASGLVGKISSGLKTAGTIAEAFSIGYTIGTLIRNGLEAVAPGIMKPIDDAVTWWLDNSEAGKWLLKLTGDAQKAETAEKASQRVAKQRQEIAKKYEAMGIDTLGGTSSGLTAARTTLLAQRNSWTPNLVGGSTSSTPRINSAADYKIYLDSGKLVGGTSKAYSSASANSYNYVTKGYSR